jgi:hypothetical protein
MFNLGLWAKKIELVDNKTKKKKNVCFFKRLFHSVDSTYHNGHSIIGNSVSRSPGNFWSQTLDQPFPSRKGGYSGPPRMSIFRNRADRAAGGRMIRPVTLSSVVAESPRA